MPGAEAARRYRERHPERALASKRRYAASDRGKAKTAEYNRRYAGARKLMVDAFKASPCFDCGGRFPAQVMEFDHRDGVQKVDDVAVMARKAMPSAIFAEIAKCDLVCANCHRIRTIGRQLDEQLSPLRGSH